MYRDNLPAGTTLGFVPTMGALHEGHAALIQKSAAENQITVLSIFVNPTQFNNADDLQKYPRTWDADLKKAQEAGATVVLHPTFDELYVDNYRYKMTESEFSKKLCGAFRPGHFDGVLSVVLKLFLIVNPQKAYFGEKDFQQLQLIKDMAASYFLRTEVIGCTTVRESDGLALSSRNVRLSSAGREKAPALFKGLSDFQDINEARAFLQKAGIEVEYLEEHFNRRFVAAFIDGVRLIDNVAI